MKIIISPSKKMTFKDDYAYKTSYPDLNKASKIYDFLKTLSIDEIKEYFKLSDKLALNTYQMLQRELSDATNCAIASFEGIQFQYLNYGSLNDEALDYLNDHLFIISALYGLLKPFDLIIPHRLEMGLKIKELDLYQFWNDLGIQYKDEVVINLASKEYSKAILHNLNKCITISFKEDVGKLVEKGVYVKMARGSFLRYMAINQINDPEDLKNFNDLGYHFEPSLSNDNHYVFVRKGNL